MNFSRILRSKVKNSRAIAPDWRVRVGDYQFLKDPVFRQSLRENQITLIGWEDAALLNSASALRK